MFLKTGFLRFCILFSMIFLPACSAKIDVVPSATLSGEAAPPLTVSLPPAIDTPNSPIAAQPALLVEGNLIKGMVDIGERNLYIHCEGEGSPPIILEAGLAADSTYWNSNEFFENIVKITRTCKYDRANIGKSDPAPAPRTAQDSVNDLHILLANARIPGPYVLVGHSYGGALVRVYAGEFPDDIKGVVLLDSMHPDQFSRTLAALPTQSPDESENLKSQRENITRWLKPGVLPEEQLDFLTSLEQIRNVTSLGDVPLLVLTAGGYNADCNKTSTQNKDDPWFVFQSELAGLSTNSTHNIICNAGHTLWETNAEEVVSKIRLMITWSRSYIP